MPTYLEIPNTMNKSLFRFPIWQTNDQLKIEIYLWKLKYTILKYSGKIFQHEFYCSNSVNSKQNKIVLLSHSFIILGKYLIVSFFLILEAKLKLWDL